MFDDDIVLMMMYFIYDDDTIDVVDDDINADDDTWPYDDDETDITYTLDVWIRYYSWFLLQPIVVLLPCGIPTPFTHAMPIVTFCTWLLVTDYVFFFFFPIIPLPTQVFVMPLFSALDSVVVVDCWLDSLIYCTFDCPLSSLLRWCAWCSGYTYSR